MADLFNILVFRRALIPCAFVMVLVCTGCRSIKKTTTVVVPKPGEAATYVDGPGIAEPVSDPAEICFADTHFYARFSGLAGHNQPEVNPFAKQISELLAPLNTEGLVDRAAVAFGDSNSQLFDRFFGTDLALIDRMHPRRSPLLIISKAAPEDIKRLPAVLNAKPWAEAPANGGYPTYVVPVSDGNELLLALGTHWFFLCDREHGKALRALLRADDAPRQSLAALPAYVDFRGKSPEAAFGFAFARAKSQDYHGAAISATDSGYNVDVFSKVQRPMPPAGLDAYPFLAQLHQLDFGILPQSTIGAVALNAIHQEPKDLGILDIPLIFGSVRTKILPGVQPPVLGVVADAPMSELGDGVTVPALAVCARVNDASVGNAIDSMIRTFQFLASLGALDFSRTLFGFKKHSFEGVSYKVADFGDGIIARLPEGPLLPLADLPKPAGLRQLTIGQIDDWYVICSQESFFQACVTAARDPSKRWMNAPQFADYGFRQRSELIASFAVDAPRASTLVASAGDLYEQARTAKGAVPQTVEESTPRKAAPPLRALDNVMHTISDVTHQLSEGWFHLHAAPVEAPKPKAESSIGEKKRGGTTAKPAAKVETDRALKPLRWVSDAIGRHHSFAAQFWRDQDGNPQGTIRLLIPNQRAAGPN